MLSTVFLFDPCTPDKWRENVVTSRMSDSQRCAYTLVELLSAIAIIGLLLSLMLPAIQAAREASNRATCANHIRQLAMAAMNHESANRSYPPGYLGEAPAAISIQPTTNSYVGHLVYLMPHLELEAIYNIWASKRDLSVAPRVVVPNDPRYVRWANGPTVCGMTLLTRSTFFSAHRMMRTGILWRRSLRCAPHRPTLA